MNEFLIYDRTRNDLLLSVTQTFFFFRLYLLTVLNEKKFAVSNKKAKNVTNPRRVRK